MTETAPIETKSKAPELAIAPNLVDQPANKGRAAKQAQQSDELVQAKQKEAGNAIALRVAQDPLQSKYAISNAAGGEQSPFQSYFPAPGLAYLIAKAMMIAVKTDGNAMKVYANLEAATYNNLNKMWNAYRTKDMATMKAQAYSQMFGAAAGLGVGLFTAIAGGVGLKMMTKLNGELNDMQKGLESMKDELTGAGADNQFGLSQLEDGDVEEKDLGEVGKEDVSVVREKNEMELEEEVDAVAKKKAEEPIATQEADLARQKAEDLLENGTSAEEVEITHGERTKELENQRQIKQDTIDKEESEVKAKERSNKTKQDAITAVSSAGQAFQALNFGGAAWNIEGANLKGAQDLADKNKQLDGMVISPIEGAWGKLLQAVGQIIQQTAQEIQQYNAVQQRA